VIFKAVCSKIKNIKKNRPKETELDYDTGVFMRLWNVKTVVSAVLRRLAPELFSSFAQDAIIYY
jgi:hypothetical protein